MRVRGRKVALPVGPSSDKTVTRVSAAVASIETLPQREAVTCKDRLNLSSVGERFERRESEERN